MHTLKVPSIQEREMREGKMIGRRGWLLAGGNPSSPAGARPDTPQSSAGSRYVNINPPVCLLLKKYFSAWDAKSSRMIFGGLS